MSNRKINSNTKYNDPPNESLLFYKTLFENSKSVMMVIDPLTGKIIDVNNAAAEFYGYTKEKFLSMRISDINVLADDKLYEELNPEIYRQKNCFNFTHRISSGEVRAVEVDANPIKFNDNEYLFFIIHDIDEKNKTQDKPINSRYLSKENKYYETLTDILELNDKIYNSSVIGEAVYNSAGQCISVNEKLVQLIGATKEQALSQNFRELDSWKKYEITDIAKKVLQDGKSIQKDIYMVTTFGKEIWMDFNAVRFFANGEPHLLLMIYEITKRKKALEELSLSEEHFRRVFEEGPIGIAMVGLDHRFIKINYKFCQITGFTENELKSLTFEDITHPDDIKDNKTVADIMPLAKNNFYNVDKRYIRKNKEIIWVNLTSTFLRNQNGDPLYFISMIENISLRKKAEDIIRESENTMQSIFHSAPLGMGLISDRKFIIVNDIICNMTGYSRDELQGKEVKILYNSDSDYEIAGNFLYKEITETHAVKLETKTRRKDGSVFDILLSISAAQIKDAGTSFIFSVLDISERKKMEKELDDYRLHLEDTVNRRTIAFEEVNKRLEEEIIKVKDVELKERLALEKEKELSELKSKFVSITSHEFRTPLTTLLSSIEILEMAGKNYDEGKRIVHYQKMKNNIEFMVKMIDELLYLNRIDSNRIKVSYSKTNLKEFCTEILESVKENYNSIDSVFNAKLHTNEFNVERDLLRKILSNLLVNAFKFNREKGKVSLTAFSNNGQLFFEIADTGIGIPENEQKNLFEPFSRMSNSQHIKGTGLGLSIVKKSIEQLGGNISFTSNSEGTIFVLVIPCN